MVSETTLHVLSYLLSVQGDSKYLTLKHMWFDTNT